MPMPGMKLSGPVSVSAISLSFHAAWSRFKVPQSGTNRYALRRAEPCFAVFPAAFSSFQMNAKSR